MDSANSEKRDQVSEAKQLDPDEFWSPYDVLIIKVWESRGLCSDTAGKAKDNSKRSPE